MVIVSLKWIGFELVTSWLFADRTTVAMPVSGPADPERNTLGAAGCTTIFRASLMPPGVRSTTSAFPLIWIGNWALICVGEVNTIGTTAPPMDRQESARIVGTGTSVAASVIGLNWLPKTL